MTKIEELEARISQLEKLLSQIIITDKTGWKKLSEAAQELGVSTQTLRRKIFQSKAFPDKSPYKKGVHWRGDNHYYIHVYRWQNLNN